MKARWTKSSTTGALLLGVIGSLAGCTATADGADPAADVDTRADVRADVGPEAAELARGTVALGASLLDAVAEEERGNVLIAPMNVTTNLGMISKGLALSERSADHDTSREIRGGFGANGMSEASFDAGFKELLSRTKIEGPSTSIAIHNIGVAAWLGASGLNDAFADALVDVFDAPPANHSVDGPEPEEHEDFRADLNGYVAASTGDLVRELLPLGSVHDKTSLVFLSASRLDVIWAAEFDIAKTDEDGVFHTPSGDIRAALMRQENSFNYVEAGGAQIVELPCGSNSESDKIVFDFVLPDGDIDAVELKDALPVWLDSIDRAQPTKVDLMLPRFRAEPAESLDLVKALDRIDLPVGGTDMSAIYSEEGKTRLTDRGADTRIEGVFHKAVLEVDERGARFAAGTATTVGTRGLSMGSVPFHADRPFFFVVRHLETGAVLGLGRITDPA